jgi:hypothetical protein
LTDVRELSLKLQGNALAFRSAATHIGTIMTDKPEKPEKDAKAQLDRQGRARWGGDRLGSPGCRAALCLAPQGTAEKPSRPAPQTRRRPIDGSPCASRRPGDPVRAQERRYRRHHPAHWLKTITATGLGNGAFEALRKEPDNLFDSAEYARIARS